MNKIQNSKQLQEEIIRLKYEVKQKEVVLKENYIEFKEGFTPGNLALKALSSATGVNFTKGDFISSSIIATISIIARRLLSRKEFVLEKKITSWAETIVEKIKEFRSKDKE